MLHRRFNFYFWLLLGNHIEGRNGLMWILLTCLSVAGLVSEGRQLFSLRVWPRWLNFLSTLLESYVDLRTATLSHQDRLRVILHFGVLRSVMTNRYGVTATAWLDNTRGQWTWCINFLDRMFRLGVHLHSGVVLSRTHTSLLIVELGADFVVYV